MKNINGINVSVFGLNFTRRFSQHEALIVAIKLLEDDRITDAKPIPISNSDRFYIECAIQGKPYVYVVV